MIAWLPKALFGQQSIDAMTTVNDAATTSSYTDDATTLNFGEGFDERVTDVTVGAATYEVSSALPTQVFFRRNAGAHETIPDNRQILWYREESRDGNSVNLEATQIAGMEEGLGGNIINRGTDNVFANDGNSSGNNNNIERIDFVFNQNRLTPQNQAHLDGVGFTVMERGGNDTFTVAAITAIDGAGTPTQYAAPVTVSESDWGSSLWNDQTTVVNGDEPGLGSHTITAELSSQDAKGIFFTLSDLGISAGDDVLGYSLFAPDTGNAVGTDSSLLLDWLNDTYFPTDTDDVNTGGLDLISGGSGIIEQNLDTTDLIVAVPEPTSVLLAVILGLVAMVAGRVTRGA